MLEIYEAENVKQRNAKKESEAPGEYTVLEVSLTFEERQKSRYKTATSCGKALGWFLERGQILADGDYLVAKDGTKIKVNAAVESVSTVTSTSALMLMKAAYHLGNRHVPLQVEQTFLRYQSDHVLDEMVRGLGLMVNHEHNVFHPESGAYAHGHTHHH